jgi:hypothetical protein
MSEKEIAVYVRQVITAISYIHSKGILHREYLSSHSVSNCAISILIRRIRSNWGTLGLPVSFRMRES